MSKLLAHVNQLNASPSYRDLGQSKPHNEKYYRPPLPIRYVSCAKCHGAKGTFFARMGKKGKEYLHQECFPHAAH